MSQEKITMASPLAEIAKIIATNYLQRPFPKDLSPNGLLDYTSIRKQKINPDDVRVIHGYSNACRVAALIPQLLKLYEKHVDELVPELQHEIKAITEADIKEFMIVALMRSTGRTRDGGHGDEFAAQGKKECLSYLEYLGMEDAAKREALASMIVDCEGGKKGKLTLGAILLADATLMETFRDGLSYEDKNIYLDYFPFFHMLASPKKLDTINEFINFCTIHAQVIHKHQGFLFSALKCKHSPNEKLQIAWPVDKYSDELHKKGEEQIKKLDYSINCYEQCLQDVNKAFDVFWEATKYKMYSEIPALLSLTAQLQQKIPPNSSLAAFIQELIQFFEPIVARGEIVTDGNNVFEISWNSILQAWPYYFNGKEYEQIQPLDLREIFSQKLARKEGEDPLNFIERVLDYFEPKIGRAFFVDDNGKVTPLKWSIIIYIIEHTLQDTNIKKVRERIYKTVINSIKKVKEEESVSSVIIEFTSSQAALQAVKYLTFFAQKYNIKENIQYATGHTMLQLSKEFWGKCQYPERELPEHIGSHYAVKGLRANETHNTVDFFLDGILPMGDHLYQDIRPPLKGKYTIYANGIVKRKNKIPMYSQEVKRNYSQIQSMTFLNADASTEDPFGSKNTNLPYIGVAISENDLLLNRLFIKDGVGHTVKRKVDAETPEAAKKIYSSLKENLVGVSKEEMKKFKRNENTQVNEVLTRARWNPKSSKVVIFKNNFRSRIYAQDLARRIEERLVQRKEVGSDFQVPILFYLPQDNIRHLAYYTDAMQQEDIKEAKRQYDNEGLRQENYTNNAYEFLLALERKDITNALLQNTPSLLYLMLEAGYIAIAERLFFKCTEGDQARIIKNSQASCLITKQHITKGHLLKIAKMGHVDLCRKLMGDWRPPKDDFWLSCFERDINPKVIKLIGYEKTLRMLAEAGYWDRIDRILEKIHPQLPEQYNRKRSSKPILF